MKLVINTMEQKTDVYFPHERENIQLQLKKHAINSKRQKTDVHGKQRVLSTCGLRQTSTGAICTARPIENITIKMLHIDKRAI